MQPSLPGAYGVKKGVDAYSDNEEAEKLNEDAEALLSEAERRLKCERNKCTKRLKELGWLKLETWDSQLGRFVTIFESLREVEFVSVLPVWTIWLGQPTNWPR